MAGFTTRLLVTFCLFVNAEAHSDCDHKCIDEHVKVTTYYTTSRSVILKCRDWFHLPEVFYLWYTLYPGIGYESSSQDSTVTISEDGSNLTYNSFSSDTDGAEFKCQIMNFRDNNRAKVFRLRYPQIRQTNVQDEHTIYQIPQFRYLMIPCTFQGDLVGDDFHFIWSKVTGGHTSPLSADDDRLYVDLSGNLHFTPVLKMDQDFDGNSEYRCDVYSPRMSRGAYGNYASINVTSDDPTTWEKPQLKYKSNDVVIAASESAILECVFDDNSLTDTTIRWYRPDGKILTPRHPDKYELLHKEKRLIVHDVRECDQGTYYCEARNGFGSSDKHPINIRAICMEY